MLQQALQPGDRHLRPPAGLLAVSAPNSELAGPGGRGLLGTAVPDRQTFNGPPDPSRAVDLDALGRRYGTDLSSLGRDCLRHWQRLLVSPWDQPFDLLEIGVGSGASLRTWREWFPRARLVGLDVRRVAVHPPIAGCSVVHGSQTDHAVLRQLVREYRFRLIIDDGSPYWDDKLRSFLTLFPWLDPDSAYFLADSQASTSPLTREDADATAGSASLDLSWFADLATTVAGRSAHAVSRGALEPLEHVVALATGVALFPGSVVVIR
jgi:hypothetical protein